MEKCVLITGASSGIGKETAILLAKSGFKVFAGTRRELDYSHENIHPVFLDVVNEKSIDEAFKSVQGELFAVINNAGIAISSPVKNLTREELQKQLDVVVFGALAVTQKFLPKLQKGGKIINISSMASFGIFPFISPYCAAKRTLDILFTALEIESGIKVVSVKPGAISTPFWENCIKINEENFKNFIPEFEKEGKFLVENARKNALYATKPEKVAKKISDILNSKNPKSSYTIGFDAFVSEIFSKFDTTLIIKIVKFILKQRMKK